MPFTLPKRSDSMNIKFWGSLSLLLGLSFSAFASSKDPLVGTWKTIDDRTGYSLADVVIRKDEKSQQYAATIVNVRNVPGAPTAELCTQCTGKDKNKPLVGLEMLTGLIPVLGKQNEFRSGALLDPNNGQHYEARARLMSSGKHLILHVKSAESTLGRNLTWVKN